MNKQKSKTAKKQSWADVAVRSVAILSASTLMGMGGYFALSAHSLWPLLIPGALPGAFIMLPAMFWGGSSGAMRSKEIATETSGTGFDIYSQVDRWNAGIDE